MTAMTTKPIPTVTNYILILAILAAAMSSFPDASSQVYFSQPAYAQDTQSPGDISIPASTAEQYSYEGLLGNNTSWLAQYDIHRIFDLSDGIVFQDSFDDYAPSEFPEENWTWESEEGAANRAKVVERENEETGAVARFLEFHPVARFMPGAFLYQYQEPAHGTLCPRLPFSPLPDDLEIQWLLGRLDKSSFFRFDIHGIVDGVDKTVIGPNNSSIVNIPSDEIYSYGNLLQPFERGIWYLLKVSIDLDSQEYTVSVDDNNYGAFPLPVHVDSLTNISFFGDSGLGAITIEDVEVSTPNRGDYFAFLESGADSPFELSKREARGDGEKIRIEWHPQDGALANRIPASLAETHYLTFYAMPDGMYFDFAASGPMSSITGRRTQDVRARIYPPSEESTTGLLNVEMVQDGDLKVEFTPCLGLLRSVWFRPGEGIVQARIIGEGDVELLLTGAGVTPKE